MVTFYKVTAASWAMGKLLVRVPYYSMVNLVAAETDVPELMQLDCTGPKLAKAAARLLDDESARAEMKQNCIKSHQTRAHSRPHVRSTHYSRYANKEKDYAVAAPSPE